MGQLAHGPWELACWHHVLLCVFGARLTVECEAERVKGFEQPFDLGFWGIVGPAITAYPGRAGSWCPASQEVRSSVFQNCST
jgi:hypothetical protein